MERNLKTNEKRQRLDSTIFVDIEGSGVNDVVSGEDKSLLMKWGLTEEAANELRHSVCDWSKHLFFELILNPWGFFLLDKF